MEYSIPSMTRLFAQLGLRSSQVDIDAFISAHRPLSPDTDLPDAVFWTASQADFLRSEVEDDAAWSIVIDRLSATLRHSPRLN